MEENFCKQDSERGKIKRTCEEPLFLYYNEDDYVNKKNYINLKELVKREEEIRGKMIDCNINGLYKMLKDMDIKIIDEFKNKLGH